MDTIEVPGSTDLTDAEKSIVETDDDFKRAICLIKITAFGKTKTFNLGDDISINYEKLELEMDSFPQVYHLWAMVYAEVKGLLDSLDIQIRKRRAFLRSTIIKESESKMRRGDVEDLIDCDDDLMNLEAQKVVIEKKARKLYHTLEALKMKNDNMRSLFGFKKQELAGSR